MVCKYCETEISEGIEHEICTNENLKKINKSGNKNIPCVGSKCGRFEKIEKNQTEEINK